MHDKIILIPTHIYISISYLHLYPNCITYLVRVPFRHNVVRRPIILQAIKLLDTGYLKLLLVVSNTHRT